MLKRVAHFVAAAVLLLATMEPRTASCAPRRYRSGKKHSAKSAATEKAAVGPVPPRVVIEADDAAATDHVPRIHVGVGQYTAVYTTSPIRQLVSTLIDAATVTVKENRRATEDNVAYLTAAQSGARGNCWIETGDGIVEVEIRTTAGPAYTREVQIRTKGHRSEMQSLKLRAQYAESEASRYRTELGNAKAAVQSALRTVGDAKEAGFASGMTEGLLALEKNLAGAKMRKLSEVKSGALRVWQVGRPVRTPTGWLTLYRVENKGNVAMRLFVTSDSGPVTMANAEAHVLARSTTTFAIFTAAPDPARAPHLRFTSGDGPGLVAALVY